EEAALCERLATLAHEPTWLAVRAERAVSRALGGSCSMPLAAHARWEGATLRLEAVLGDPQPAAARPLLRAQAGAEVVDPASAEALGLDAVAALRAGGADAYLGPA